MGLALKELKRYEEAINCYRKGIEINSKNASLHNNMGKVLDASERYL
jgi:tetratricopeptide (TPR) repeat protein